MILYKKDDISISLIENDDIEEVIKLFNSFSFNVTLDTGLRPTSYEFRRIIEENIERDKKIDTVLVLKLNGMVIGYLSCFVDYSRIVLGHIAVNQDFQHQGYGRLLTLVALHLASLSDRDVSCTCYYPNKYLSELGFKTRDGVFYLFKDRAQAPNDMQDIFISLEDYEMKKRFEMEKEVEDFSKFLDSGIGLMLKNL